MTTSSLPTSDELLKRTRSRCPVCHAPCPAEVWRTGGIPAQVFLKRIGPEHGEASVCIASDARFYWLAQGKAENACLPGSAGVPPASCCDPPDSARRRDDGAPRSCCSADGSNTGTLGRNADPGNALGVMERLATCLALIEIVNSCNLARPTCYARALSRTLSRSETVRHTRHDGDTGKPAVPLGRQFELDESRTFRLFIKPFMDAQTWDEDRIDRCCTRVIRPWKAGFILPLLLRVLRKLTHEPPPRPTASNRYCQPQQPVIHFRHDNDLAQIAGPVAPRNQPRSRSSPHRSLHRHPRLFGARAPAR